MAGVLVWSAVAGAQERATTGGIEGSVFDSLSRRPLSRAAVQLTTRPGVEPRRTLTTASDSLGRFRIDGVPGGGYLVSFAHPLLDSLGIEPVVREINVPDRGNVRVTLATPSSHRLIAELCPKESAGDSATLLVGHVRDARTAMAIPGASVSLAWPEVVSEGRRLTSSEQKALVAANGDGWFAICNAPAGIDLAARAASGADSSGRLLLVLAPGDLVRRELFVGPVQRDSTSATAGGAPVLRGTSVLRGRVILDGAGTPLPGAQLQLWGTAGRATSGADGSFALGNLPIGSHMLDVRAIGYIPVRTIVDVLDDGEAEPVVVPLASAKHYLDTVRVTASRVYSSDANGFERRRRMGVGKFITSEDVAKSPRMFVSDYLSSMLGVWTTPAPGGNLVLLRGNIGRCVPTVYIDHLRYNTMDQFYGESNVDAYVWPSEIEGIEVYTRAPEVPPMFNTMNDCGAIIIWTNRGKPTSAAPKKR